MSFEDEWKEFKGKNGILLVKLYPSKQRFLEEAARNDCGSYPMLHVSIQHSDMSTVELFDLFHHEFPPSNIKNKQMRLKLITHFLKGKFLHPTTIISVNQIVLNERIEKPSSYSEQIILTPHVVINLKEDYRVWIHWCKQMLKKSRRFAKFVDKKEIIYNPYEGLQFRVWVEFHD